MIPCGDLRHLGKVYGNASFPHLIHVLVRRLTCPFDTISDLIPSRGLHVDVGCGHGVLLALLQGRYPEKTMMGIDIDSRKIAQARKGRFGNVEFLCGDVNQLPALSVDSLSMVDVLYLLPDPGKAELLAACAGVMKFGGTLVVKDLITAPAWKHRIISIEEHMMVRVLRITRGESVSISSAEALEEVIASSGFSPPRVFRCDRGYPYPHICFVSRKVGV